MPHHPSEIIRRLFPVLFTLICVSWVVACVAPPYEPPGGESSDTQNTDTTEDSSDTGSDDEAGDGDTEDDSEDDDCGFGQELNADGECVPRCFFDQCPPGYTCNEATDLCEPDSDADDEDATGDDDTGDQEGPCDPANCPEGYTCPDDQSSSECVPVEDGGCAGVFDCEFGETCVEGQCQPLGGELVTVCSDDGDCPLLMTCQMGVCVGCLDDLMCAGDARCVLGVCVEADLGTAGDCINMECSEGQACNWQTGVCEPTCSEDADCPEEEFCSAITQFCTPEFRCETDADCTTGSCVGGVCVGCTDDTDCQQGLTCTFGACLPNPVGSDPCSAANCDEATEACDPLDGSCYPADGTCSSDDECREVHDCSIFGVCTGCEVDGDCRPDQRCILSACVLL